MHAPITRYEVQPAGSDRAEKQLGRRGTVPERKTVGSLSKEDAARPQYLGLRHAVPSARSSAQQSLEVRRQQRRTTRLFPGVKIASASAVALNPLFATRQAEEFGIRAQLRCGSSLSFSLSYEPTTRSSKTTKKETVEFLSQF